MSRLDVDGLRWEVRARGAGTPLLLLHGFTGRGTSWGGSRRRRSRARSGSSSWTCRATAAATTGDRAPHDRRARPPTTWPRSFAALDAAPADVVGYSLGRPDRAPPRRRPSRRRRPARPREPVAPGIADEAARDRTTGRRRAPRRQDRARRHPARSSPSGSAADLRDPGRPAPGPRRADPRDPPRQPPRRARRQPPRRRPGRDGAPRTIASARSAPRRSSSPAPSTHRARPRAESVAVGIPGARLAIVDGSGHTPHDERPARFRRLALDFLQEDAA